MMDLEVEHGGPDLDDGDGDDSVFGVNVSVSELDNRWHNVSTMIPADQLTPDAIAEAMISVMVGLAAARGSTTLIALQQRLMAWGQES